MHIEFLCEDASGKRMLETIIPLLLGEPGNAHTWRIHAYKRIGRLPTNLSRGHDPRKRILLDRLPKLLRGYAKTPGIDAVVVVADVDQNDCRDFLSELKTLASRVSPTLKVMFRLAIEEMEAWYLGDRYAVQAAYPQAKTGELDTYIQDSRCGTWEKLADAVYPGGSDAIKQKGWPAPGRIKHEWAENITPHMIPGRNQSPSFMKFCEGLAHLISF